MRTAAGIPNQRVEITAHTDTTALGPTPTARLANAYSVLIPDNGVAEWTIDVRIEHTAHGVTAFSHPLRGVAADDEPWWTSTPVLVVAWTLPVLGLFILHRAGNTQRTQRSCYSRRQVAKPRSRRRFTPQRLDSLERVV